MAITINARGTSMPSFQVGKKGPLIQNENGSILVKNKDNNGFADLRAAGFRSDVTNIGITDAVNINLTCSGSNQNPQICVKGDNDTISLDILAKGEGTINLNSPTKLDKAIFSNSPIILTGTSVTPDLTQSNIFTWTMNNNSILNNPSIPGPGIWYIYVTIDSFWHRSLGFDTLYNRIDGNFRGHRNTVNILKLVSDGSEIDVWIYQR